MAYEAAKTSEVAYMETVRRLFGAYKPITFDRMRLRPGQRVLEVGCGPGEDAEVLAKQVGPTGEVVGIDKDPEMLAAARTRAAQADPPFAVQEANVYELPFPDRYFAACRADRVFQHLYEPGRALAEMVRVTKPGGCVLVFDVDWETLTVSASDLALTRRILQHGSDLHRCGPAGRLLFRLFAAQDMANIHCETHVTHTTDWEIARWAFGLEHYARTAEEKGVIDTEGQQGWLGDLAQQARNGGFFAAIVGVIAYGTVR